MQDPSFVALRSDRLVVRRFTPTDAEALADYRSDPAVARYQAWDRPYTVADADEFIRSLHDQAPGTPGSWFQFAVALAPSGPLVGDCALRADADDPRQGELGCTFASPFQGQGLATEAVSVLLDYAFATLDVHRVVAIVDTRNHQASRLLERLRFRREGHFRENAWFKGAWTSEYLFARLRAEHVPGYNAERRHGSGSGGR